MCVVSSFFLLSYIPRRERIHGSREKKERKKKSLPWKMIRLFQHLLKFFFPLLSLCVCVAAGEAAPIFPLCVSHFIIPKLQAISMLIGYAVVYIGRKRLEYILLRLSMYFYAGRCCSSTVNNKKK
jgi:hypothetical protein